MDKLLYSCIELLLNVPHTLLPIPNLIRALKIGRTHLPAGELAARVLQRWCMEHMSEIEDLFVHN